MSHRQSSRYRIGRVILVSLFVLLLLLLDAHHHAPTRPIQSYALPPHLKAEKIFIGAIFRNSGSFLREHWNDNLLLLVDALGPENVFVSIVESASQDDTKSALQVLEKRLDERGVRNRIVLGVDFTAHEERLVSPPREGQDRSGWIFTGTGAEGQGWEMRRIPYLAELRNQVMRALYEDAKGVRFDRVLWINDVVFTVRDVLTLLETRNGTYAAACALDFSETRHEYYDSFALRDSNGYKTVTPFYPYFHSTSDITLMQTHSPLRVKSCWNGLISLSASPFYALSPLHFRGISDSLASHHLEASECCLIHFDNPLTASKGVWLNPNVRVAYDFDIYNSQNGDKERETKWRAGVRAWRFRWMNRLAGPVAWPLLLGKREDVRKRVRGWKMQGVRMRPREDRMEEGLDCLENEMQVMRGGGWTLDPVVVGVPA